MSSILDPFWGPKSTKNGPKLDQKRIEQLSKKQKSKKMVNKAKFNDFWPPRDANKPDSARETESAVFNHVIPIIRINWNEKQSASIIWGSSEI